MTISATTTVSLKTINTKADWLRQLEQASAALRSLMPADCSYVLHFDASNNGGWQLTLLASQFESMTRVLPSLMSPTTMDDVPAVHVPMPSGSSWSVEQHVARDLQSMAAQTTARPSTTIVPEPPMPNNAYETRSVGKKPLKEGVAASRLKAVQVPLFLDNPDSGYCVKWNQKSDAHEMELVVTSMSVFVVCPLTMPEMTVPSLILNCTPVLPIIK